MSLSLKISSNTYTYLKLNVVIIVAFAASLLLSYLKFPYFQYLFGFLIILAGSLNIAAALEILLKEKQGLAKISIWTLLFSIFLFPVFSFLLLHLLPVRQISQILISIVYPLVTFCLYLLFEKLINYSGVTKLTTYSKPKLKKYSFLAFLYILILSINFFLYKYIPEADPYNYLTKVNQFSTMGFAMLDNVRPLFSIFLYSISATTSIDPYWILKIILPMFFVAIPLLIAKPIVDTNKFSKYAYLPVLLFLAFPVVVEEVLISRPQSLFLLSLPLFLYIMSNASVNKSGRSFIAPLVILFLSAVGLKIHPFFGLTAFVALLMTILAAWPTIKKFPIESALIILMLFFLLMPQLKGSSIDNLRELLSLFVKFALKPTFTLWFIDSYRSVDGVQMGWPGITAAFYYVYNLGLASPVLAVLYLALFKNINKDKKASTNLYLSVIIVFFSVAEIFPRLGLAYLPDRAWLFIAVLLPFILTPILIKIFYSSRLLIKFFLIAAMALSIFLSYFITYAKSGWTTQNEREAAIYLKNNSSANSLVIAQGGNVFTIKYFAQRYYVDLNNNLLKKNPSEFKQEISSLVDKENQIKKIDEKIDKEKSELLIRFKDQLFTESVTNQHLNQLVNSRITSINNLQIDRKAQILKSDNKEIYLMYSMEKFEGLYGMRDWWKSNNLYGANLSILNDYPVVFEKGGVKIWKISN